MCISQESEVVFAENPVLASQMHDLEGADGVTRSSPRSCDNFFVIVGRMQGCLLELRGRGVMGLSRYLKTMSCRNLTILCSAPHPSLDQPLLPQGPTWRIEHCLHTAPQYNCYLFIHLKSAALLLFPAPRSCVCRMPSPGCVFSEVIS